jgi:hypothetical protein
MHTNLRSLIRRRQHVKQQRNISTPQREISFHRVQRLHSVIMMLELTRTEGVASLPFSI